jgi:RNA polymerase sigma-70 factor (ECF subfamily)
MINESIITNFENEFLVMEDKLFNVAYGILRNQCDAEDVVHDAFIKAAENLSQLKNADKLSYWLCTITRNKALEKYNKKKREILMDCGIYDSVQYHYISDFHSDFIHPERVCINHDYKRYLKEKISNILDPCSRDILFAFYFDSMSYKEIAQKFNMKEGTIKSRISRSKARIKLLLENVII